MTIYQNDDVVHVYLTIVYMCEIWTWLFDYSVLAIKTGYDTLGLGMISVRGHMFYANLFSIGDHAR